MVSVRASRGWVILNYIQILEEVNIIENLKVPSYISSKQWLEKNKILEKLFS